MKRKGNGFRFRKTPTNQRATYTYINYAGQKIVLRPGEKDVTEVDIKLLHSIDDAEVNNNLKNSRPKPTEKVKQQMREWEEQHPGEKAPRNYNVPLDAPISEEDSTPRSETIAAPEKTVSPRVERMREIVDTMTERQKQVYYHLYVHDFNVKETAAILGISSPAVTKYKKRIIEIIKKNFERG